MEYDDLLLLFIRDIFTMCSQIVYIQSEINKSKFATMDSN